MPNEFFDDLYESMQQAEAIAKGEMQPAMTRFEVADVEAIREKKIPNNLVLKRVLHAKKAHK